MLKIALTGNIASGKSTVARVWRELGAWVTDADELARRAVEPGTPGLRAVVERWGRGVLDESGRLDRAALREIVFRDDAERAHLEEIVHPAVAMLRAEEEEKARASGATTIVADIPLLYETGLNEEFDIVVLVDAPEEVRLARLVRDRGLKTEEAQRMIAAQMPARLKRERADYVIENDGSLEALREEAARVWQELQS